MPRDTNNATGDLITAGMLQDAADQIKIVADQLDRSEQPCQSCGSVRKLNWNEFQMATELDAMIRKLRAFAGKLAVPRPDVPPNPRHNAGCDGEHCEEFDCPSFAVLRKQFLKTSLPKEVKRP